MEIKKTIHLPKKGSCYCCPLLFLNAMEYPECILRYIPGNKPTSEIKLIEGDSAYIKRPEICIKNHGE